MKNIYLQLIEELKKNSTLVLGTLLKTKGSTPQVPGVSAIFNIDGLLIGTLGGGVLEAETTQLAKGAIKSGKHIFQEYSLNADITEKTGAICGGTATFLLDAHPDSSLPVFQEIQKDIENRIPGVLITVIEKKEKQSVSISRNWFSENKIVPTVFSEKYGIGKNEIANFLKVGSSPDFKITSVKNDKGEYEISVFIEPIFPLAELVIVGAGHVGQALCHLANLVDFNITLIDNRAELATHERFPEASRIINEDIERGFQKINITENTFVVIVTQGHQDDAVALKCCLHSRAAYIGMIGSKRKTALMREKFITDGIATKAELDKIYAPIGIDIHSKTVNEIAVSIVAQLIDIRYSVQYKKQSPKIHCLVLAAGESKRMKQQKMLLPFNGKTIVETVIEKAKFSKADETWVVLGSDKEKIGNKIAYLDVKWLENENYKAGMLSSVQYGFNALSESVDAAIILLGDQPMIETEVINRLFYDYQKFRAGIIIPTFSGKRGHPILIDMKFRNEINNLNPEIGLRELMQNHTEEILEIEVENDTVLMDIDTPEDYKKITKLK